MSAYNENIGNRILELLNFPLTERCHELAALFERCNLRELQDVFPVVVQSIFGVNSCNLGWGLRCVTKENSDEHFDLLHSFFGPMGPMFCLCYRLLNDAIKFEFSLDLLPHKVTEMLQSGQYSMFYADLINIDVFRRQVNTLSLNAFDYFVLHFVIHGTSPLHKYYPAALQVHNEPCMKTVYFFLTAEYLCAFLPSSPDSVVEPINICTTVKAPRPMPVAPMQPTRSPKYLKMPNLSMYGGNDSPQTHNLSATESLRSYAWRTESVLHFFIDIWLRYDIEEARDLPSTEFIRVVRILVKQIHTFGNVAYLDQTATATLRKLAQPMLRARIYPFLKSIIGRWPLDSSMSVVLELWLSYIQPWRYNFDWPNNSEAHAEVVIDNRFDGFIADNIVIYTQIFVHILSRFERLGFTTLRNVIMLHRLVKVFSQSTLSEKVCQAEQNYVENSSAFGSTQQGHYMRVQNSPSVASSEWDTSFHEENYMPLFGSDLKSEIEKFIRTVHMSRLYVQQEINALKREMVECRNTFGFIKKIIAIFFEDISSPEIKLQEIIKIPDILDLAVRSLQEVFNINLPQIPMDQMHPYELSHSQRNFSLYDSSDYLNITKTSPSQMANLLETAKSTVDPALLPIQSHECKILVRFLHQLSCKLNEMYGDEIQACWCRSDICGKLARQVFLPPMTAQWFDKSRGFNELCEDPLPPRICFRRLASYNVLAVLAICLIYGYLSWGAPSYALILVLLVFALYKFMLALIT